MVDDDGERVRFYKQHEKFIKLTRHLAGKNPSS